MTTRGARPDLRSGFRQRGMLLLARVFPEREVVLRTGSRRRRLIVSTKFQTLVAVVGVGAAIWQGIVTTKWLDSAATIADKDHEIVELRVDRETAIESMSYFDSHFRGLASRIYREVEDIEHNLALLARHDAMTSSPIAAYTMPNGGPTKETGGRTLGPTLDEQLARLEESLSELRSGHAELLATSAQTASAQLDRLESALAAVGIDTGPPPADADEPCGGGVVPQAEQFGEELGSGGPFIRMSDTSGTWEQPPEALHATLQRWNDLTAAMGKLPIGTPIENRRMTSGFGYRSDPINRRPAFHGGIDYGGAENSPALATGGGVVTYANRNGRYGKLVEIDHGQGFVTRYAHLAEITVAVGQEVERGTVVGRVGSTGRSTGPHLHYELRVGGQPRDPRKFIEVGTNVFKRNNESRAG